MLEILQLVAATALQIGFTYWVIRWDERRLSGPRRARAYPPATFWIAVVVFGPPSIAVHFVRTRRNWTGLMLGLGLCGAVTLLIAGAEVGIETILE